MRRQKVSIQAYDTSAALTWIKIYTEINIWDSRENIFLHIVWKIEKNYFDIGKMKFARACAHIHTYAHVRTHTYTLIAWYTSKSTSKVLRSYYLWFKYPFTIAFTYITHVFAKWYDSRALQSDFIPQNFPRDRLCEYTFSTSEFTIVSSIHVSQIWTDTCNALHVRTYIRTSYTRATRHAVPSVYAFSQKR